MLTHTVGVNIIGEFIPVTIGFAVMLTEGIESVVELARSRIWIVIIGDATIFPVIGSMISSVTFQSPIPNIDPDKLGFLPESVSFVRGLIAFQL